MKTTIYVFSGTGTSYAVAKNLSKELGDTTLISIAKSIRQEVTFSEDERIGFVFPCNFGGVPQIVKDFVEKVRIDNARYIFTMITAGGGAGLGLQIMEQLLIRKGKKLNYGNSIVITSNYLVAWYYKIVKSDKAKLEDTIKESDQKVKQIARDILKEKSYVEKGNWFRYLLPHLISSKKIIKDTRPCDRDFSAGENCTGCGVCQKVCPVQNIRLVEKKPEYLHNCQRCMACMQYCPQKAIKYKGKYINEERYYYPEISINEISEFHNGRILVKKDLNNKG